MVCLWSAEVLHALRLHRASFAAVCPDDESALEAWLGGQPVPDGVSSTLIVLDPRPVLGSGSTSLARARNWSGRDTRATRMRWQR
jgi:hypothetical protein